MNPRTDNVPFHLIICVDSVLWEMWWGELGVMVVWSSIWKTPKHNLWGHQEQSPVGNEVTVQYSQEKEVGTR